MFLSSSQMLSNVEMILSGFVVRLVFASNIGKVAQIPPSPSLTLSLFNIPLIRYSRLDWQIQKGQEPIFEKKIQNVCGRNFQKGAKWEDTLSSLLAAKILTS